MCSSVKRSLRALPGVFALVSMLFLIPILHFMETNPFFKFKYGFHEKLYVLILLCFLLVPLMVGMVLNFLLAKTKWERSCKKLLLMFGIVIFWSQSYSTVLHAKDPWLGLAGSLALVIGGGYLIFKQYANVRWVVSASSIFVLPYVLVGAIDLYSTIPRAVGEDASNSGNYGAEEAALKISTRKKNNIFVFMLDKNNLTTDLLDSEKLPIGKELPNLHRFVREDALWFFNALSNGPGTSLSMPSMLTGKMFCSSKNNHLANEESILTILSESHRTRAYLHGRPRFCVENPESCGPFLGNFDVDKPLGVLFETLAFISSFRAYPLSFPIGKINVSDVTFSPSTGQEDLEDFLREVEGLNATGNFYLMQLFYYGLSSMKIFDKFFGEFVEIIKSKGEYEDAIVVIMSDHNRNKRAEIGYGAKAEQTWRLYRVPFAIKGPGVGNAEKSPYEAQGIDIAPTLLSLILSKKELGDFEFDGVNLFNNRLEREHYFNMGANYHVFKFADRSSAAPELIRVEASRISWPSGSVEGGE